MTYLAARSDGTEMPTFISFDDVTRTYFIQTADAESLGEYNLRVMATLDYRGV